MKPSDVWQGTVGIIMIAAIAGIVAFIAYLLYGPPLRINFPGDAALATSTKAAPAQIKSAVVDSAEGFLFTCDGGKSLKAAFSAAEVKLALSDGRQLTLPQAISADGARYANTDESFVFWNKGNTAFIEENGQMTYTGCATAGQ